MENNKPQVAPLSPAIILRALNGIIRLLEGNL